MIKGALETHTYRVSWSLRILARAHYYPAWRILESGPTYQSSLLKRESHISCQLYDSLFFFAGSRNLKALLIERKFKSYENIKITYKAFSVWDIYSSPYTLDNRTNTTQNKRNWTLLNLFNSCRDLINNQINSWR